MKAKSKKNSTNLSKILKKAFTKLLLTVIVFLIGLILVKDNPKYKNIINENIYNKSFKFTKYTTLYEKYFGNILSIDKLNPTTKEVFNEKLQYQKASTYKDGVKLNVNKNYLVPTIESGIVVFVGNKEDYGDTIIIEQTNGITTWYSNISNSDIKLYDYVEKGTLIGEVKSTKLYLIFQKDGKFLDYKKYI